MTQEEKEQIAVFRFGVIFPLLDRNNQVWGEKTRIVQELTQKQWEIPGSTRTCLSRATILGWLNRYKQGGERIEALFPRDRSDSGRSRSFSDETATLLLRLRDEYPHYTIVKIIEKAKRELSSSGNHEPLKASTVYRFFSEHKKQQLNKQEDLRKFEVELANDLWQSDCMYGPKVEHNGKLVRSYLFAIIDDKSRLITASKFYLSESTESFLDCLWEALRRRGLPRILYTDNGSSFRSHRLQIGCASLQISLRYAKPYRPVGKGKIERFNRTVRMQFLPDIPEGLSLDELNARWKAYVNDVYHQRVHSSTGQTPLQRFIDDVHLLRGAPQRLPEYFRLSCERTVAKDRSIRLEGRIFEAPVGLAGKRVTLRYEQLDRVEVFFNKISYGFIHEVDLQVNSTTGRLQAQKVYPTAQGGTLFSGRKK